MFENALASDLDHVIDHTRGYWEQLRGERIFITGASGFFGCWLLESFLWANQRLNLRASATLLLRNPQSFLEKVPHLGLADFVTIVHGSLSDFTFPSGTFSHIIHAASDSSLRSQGPNLLEMLDTMTLGTRRMLDFSLACGAGKFLFTSSGAVYGKQPIQISHLSESDPINWPSDEPLSPQKIYREGKLLSELQCQVVASSSKVEATIARCFAFVGPYQPLNSQFAIANFIRDGLKGGPINIAGDGSPFRSYLYGADLAIWLMTILFRGTAGRPYNVGSQHEISIADLAEHVSKCFQPAPQVIMARQPDPGQAPERYVPSINRARSELGLQALINLEEALQRTIKWHSRTGNGNRK